MKKKIIVDLCGGTGSWSKPYKDSRKVTGERGYDVFVYTLPAWDIRVAEIQYIAPNRGEIYGILAAPPCTHLASSGARWWKPKGKEKLIEAMSIVDACLRIIFLMKPKFWALENPVGRLRRYIGEPKMYFDPCDYGDPYTKQTCLWGNFNIPKKNQVEPTEGSKMHLMPPSPSRQALRSITPLGFATAFFKANR